MIELPKIVLFDRSLPPMTIQNPYLWEPRHPFVWQQQYNVPPPRTLAEHKVVIDPLEAVMLPGTEEFLNSPSVLAELTRGLPPGGWGPAFPPTRVNLWQALKK
jgi:hypothetical protein